MAAPVQPFRLGRPDADTAQLTLPHNDEAEMALLGALLHNNKAFGKVSEILKPEFFASRVHADIYQAISTLIDRGQVADPITLKQYFEHNADLSDIGGFAYLMRLAGSLVSVTNTPDYAATIRDLAVRRRLIEMGSDIIARATAEELEPDGPRQLEIASEKLFQMMDLGATSHGFRSSDSVATSYLSQVDAASRHKPGEILGITTGLTKLNNLTGGLQRGDLVILAGRPSMGKTLVANFIATKAAMSQRPGGGKPIVVAVNSLEMSAEQLVARAAAATTGISTKSQLQGGLDSQSVEAMMLWAQEYGELPIFIDDTASVSVTAVRNRCRQLKQRHGLDLLIVDYLQIMERQTGANPAAQIGIITRGLRALAKELDIAVLLLSQLSRALEAREDKRPMLSDLRESGDIENDADVVIFAYRPAYYLERAEPEKGVRETNIAFMERQADWTQQMALARNKLDLIVSKQRRGPIGTATVFADMAAMRLADLDQHQGANLFSDQDR